MYAIEFIEIVLSMYLQGASVWDICGYMGVGDDTVNEILDTYAPLL